MRREPVAAPKAPGLQMAGLITLLLTVGFVLPTAAKRPHRKPPVKALSEEDLAFSASLEDLKSPNTDKVITAIQMLGASGRAEAVPPLLALLDQGPPSDITDMILTTFGIMLNPKVIPVLKRYLHHRRPETRLLALYGLIANNDAELGHILVTCLGDSTEKVRATAAATLATQTTVPCDQNCLDRLFLAFEHGVNDAAVAIGTRGANSDAARLLRYVGQIDITRLLPGFQGFILREDISTKTKTTILSALFELAGPAVHQFAVKLRPKLTDQNATLEVQQLVNKMIAQIADQVTK